MLMSLSDPFRGMEPLLKRRIGELRAETALIAREAISWSPTKLASV